MYRKKLIVLIGKLLNIFTALFFLLFFGFLSMIFLISDLGPKESEISRILFIIFFFLLTSTIFGIIWPKLWKLSILLSWSYILLAIANSIQQGISKESLPLFLPLLLTLFGSLLGAHQGRFYTAKLLHKIKLP